MMCVFLRELFKDLFVRFVCLVSIVCLVCFVRFVCFL